MERSFTADLEFVDQEIAGMVSQPLQILLIMLARLMNRQDRDVIDNVIEEIHLMRGDYFLVKHRQRRRLACSWA